MIQRHTIQCDLVYDTVNSLRCHATADEIYAAIAKDHPSVSRGTVYRNLNRLSESGEIKKLEIPGGADHFDHRCDGHYHVQCTKCKRVFDIDMDYIPDFEKNIRDTHGFQLTGHNIVFNGVCPGCAKTKN